MLKRGKCTQKNVCGKGSEIFWKTWLKRGKINWEMKVEKEWIFIKKKVGIIVHQI